VPRRTPEARKIDPGVGSVRKGGPTSG
jgi:hypothetical protein